jgi:plasmid stability protein
MAQLLVRRLEAEVKLGLQRLARKHGRSTEEEVRHILRAAVVERGRPARPLGSRIAARFKGAGARFTIEELRGHPAKPAELDK